MARVMHVITDLTVGGAQSMLYKLLSARSPGFEPAVVSLADGGTVAPAISELGVPVHSLGLRRNLPNPVRALQLRSMARRLNPDLIQGWLYHGNLAASLAASGVMPRPRVLWNIRQGVENIAVEKWLTRRVIRLGAAFSKKPEVIIYNSSIGAQQHEIAGYHAEKRQVIPNGFDCELFRPDEGARAKLRAELKVSPSSVLVGLIARFHPIKGQTIFLRAAALVAQQCADAHFVLIGAGVTEDQPALDLTFRERHLWDRVSFLGSRQDMPYLNAGLDIACSASFNEGFSNSIGEAMACGVPCVVTNVGDSAYVIADTGLSVPPGNPELLAHGICQLIQAGPERRRQLGEAARRRIEAEFALPAIVRRYEDLYRRLLQR